ncbi:2TM domain-containing protein [Geodermatophilus obscurus]|uniref:2TM domain-containing protein n=1 Tax=Geodermatophilus obscurus TaxID=1861 RepID=A0A1I5HIM4_9ACTN|nr:2TM domain-containing protein [Geodermatophilus obscurus]SFO48188.1 2TM domain-containing protein [Geodermatophilus obscurus]
MATDAVRQTAEQRARHRVGQKLGLALHWLVYLAVNVGLVVAAGGFAGSGWRLAGWGLGLAVHTAYVLSDLLGDLGRVRERLVQRELDREPGR